MTSRLQGAETWLYFRPNDDQDCSVVVDIDAASHRILSVYNRFAVLNRWRLLSSSRVLSELVTWVQQCKYPPSRESPADPVLPAGGWDDDTASSTVSNHNLSTDRMCLDSSQCSPVRQQISLFFAGWTLVCLCWTTRVWVRWPGCTDNQQHILKIINCSYIGTHVSLMLTVRVSPVEKKVLAILWLLDIPEWLHSVGDRFDVSKSTLHKVFLESYADVCFRVRCVTAVVSSFVTLFTLLNYNTQ